jgi:hypothetical protein
LQNVKIELVKNKNKKPKDWVFEWDPKIEKHITILIKFVYILSLNFNRWIVKNIWVYS